MGREIKKDAAMRENWLLSSDNDQNNVAVFKSGLQGMSDGFKIASETVDKIPELINRLNVVDKKLKCSGGLRFLFGTVIGMMIAGGVSRDAIVHFAGGSMNEEDLNSISKVAADLRELLRLMLNLTKSNREVLVELVGCMCDTLIAQREIAGITETTDWSR